MAATTSMVMAGLGAVSAGMQVIGGIQQNAEAKKQANYAQASATMQAQEQARVAAKQAGAEKDQAERQRKIQKISYLKSGVSLEGSPLLAMEQTRLQGERNVDEIINAGAYGAASTMAEGRMRADTYKASGRQALLSGISGGLKTGVSAYNKMPKKETVRWNS